MMNSVPCNKNAKTDSAKSQKTQIRPTLLKAHRSGKRGRRIIARNLFSKRKGDVASLCFLFSFSQNYCFQSNDKKTENCPPQRRLSLYSFLLTTTASAPPVSQRSYPSSSFITVPSSLNINMIVITTTETNIVITASTS